MTSRAMTSGNDALFELARQERLGVGRLEQRFITPSPADAKLAQVLARDQGARQPGRHGRLAGRVGPPRISGRGQKMAHRLRRYPGVLERTVELAKECAFDFKVIAPKLPDFPVPPGETEMGWLRTPGRTQGPRSLRPRPTPSGSRARTCRSSTSSMSSSSWGSRATS